MRALFAISTLAILQIFVSCSHHQRPIEHYSQLTPEQLETLNREALVIASARLEQMVTQARTNPMAAQYLASDLFLKANMSLLEGDFTTSAELFKHVSALAPEDEFIQKKYAISLIRSGDLEEAQKVLHALYLKSGEEKVGMILAGVYSGLDKDAEAEKMYQSLLVANPSNEDACVFLGKSYAIKKELKKAIDQLSACSKKNKSSGIYDYYIGKLQMDQGQVEKSIESFKLAHKKQPNLSQAANALGIIYEDKEMFSSAISLYEKHLKGSPKDASILNRMVQILFAREQYDEVIPYAERLADLEPDNLNLKVKLGILYTDAKKFPEAISVFRDLLTLAPNSDKILYYLGAIYQELREYDESIGFFSQIPASSGLYTDSSIQMANMLSALAQTEFYEQSGDTWKKQFFSHVNQKLEEHKNLQVEFSVIKAGFYEGTNQYKEAMETMMVVQDEKSFSTQHKYYLANLYEKQQKFDESTALIMGIIEKEPKNAHAWNFLGYSMLERGSEMDKAYEYIQNALKISPEDGYIRDSLGWYYFKTGDTRKALSELQFALKKVPDDVEILKHLAIVHAEMKEFKKARDFLQTALKHVRYPNDRQAILASIEKLEGDRVPASGQGNRD